MRPIAGRRGRIPIGGKQMIADILVDKTMRNSDKGLYMLLMELLEGSDPGGEKWEERVTFQTIVEYSADGKDAVAAAIKRLKAKGYLEVRKVQGDTGRFTASEYILLSGKK